MDEEERKNYFDIEVKPQMNEFKRRIEAEKMYIEHYKKVAKDRFHFFYLESPIFERFFGAFIENSRKGEVDKRMNLLMEQFMSEINQLRRRINEDLDEQVKIRKQQIDGQSQVLKELDKDWKEYK